MLVRVNPVKYRTMKAMPRRIGIDTRQFPDPRFSLEKASDGGAEFSTDTADKYSFPTHTMNASTTRRQMIGSIAALLGVGAAWVRLASAPAVAVDATALLDTPAIAVEQAVRLRMISGVGFPVQLPAELILLDNFGGQRVFGPGAHQGIDIGRRDGQPGHPIVACVDGVLVDQNVLTGNQGNSWVLQGADGDAYRYHHLQEFAADLSVGSSVTRGQVLGTMGSTGNPNAPHLHFEVRRGGPIGTPVDPVPLLSLPIAGVAVI